MRVSTLLIRRGHPVRWLIAAQFLVVVLTVAALAGLVGYLSTAAVTGLRGALSSAVPAGRGLRFATPVLPDAAAQAKAGDALVASIFPGLPVTIDRRTQTTPQRVGTGQPADQPFTLRLENLVDVRAHAVLVDGTWPTVGSAPALAGSAALTGSAALDARTAREQGLQVGDVITVGSCAGLAISLVGLWQPAPSADEFWTADQLAPRPDESGLLLVTAPTIDALDTVPLVSWTVLVQSDRLTPGGLETLTAAAARFQGEVRRDPAVTRSGAVFTGHLSDELGALGSALAAVRAASVSPIVLTAAMCVLMIVELGGLWAYARRAETALLISRGASVAQIVGLTAAESFLLSTAAGLVGLAIAAAAPGGVGIDAALAGWPVALAIGLTTVLANTGFCWRQARLPPGEQAARDSGRLPTIAAIGGLLLLVTAAIVAGWRFRAQGVRPPGGAGDPAAAPVDPIAVLAPALVLVALAAVAVPLWAVVTRGLAGWAARRPGISPVLPVRQLARRAAVFSFALVLMASATGATVLASAYDQTATQFQNATGRLRDGPDVRVESPASGDVLPGTVDSVDRYLDVPGVRAAAPVLHTPARIADVDVTLTALSARAVPDLLVVEPGYFDPVAVADDLRPAPAAGQPTIPPGGTALVLDVTATGAAAAEGESVGSATAVGELATTVWLSGPDGELQQIPMGTLTLDLAAAGQVSGKLRADVPVSQSGWRLAAVDAVIAARPFASDYSYRVTAISAVDAAGEVRPITGGQDAPWAVQSLPAPGPAQDRPDISADPRGIGWSGAVPAANLGETVRMMPAGAGSAVAPVPVVIDAAISERLGVAAGDRFTVQLTGTSRQLDVVVAQISPLLPGTAAAPTVLADLDLVNDQLLRRSTAVPRTTAAWLATDGSGIDIGAAVTDLAPPAATVVPIRSGGDAALARPAAIAYWWGAAAAVLLAVIALATVVAAAIRERRDEVAVLRGMGLSSAHQVAARRGELLLVTAAALVMGGLIGVGVSALVVPGLVSSTVIDAPALIPAVTIGGPMLWFAAAAALLAVAVVLFVNDRAVRRQAGRPTASMAQ